MCFSAGASFVASGSLGAAGAVSLKKAKKKYRFIAVVPLLFGIQQLFEGIQWLVPQGTQASLVAGYAFLFFALLLWPVYVPFALLQLEKKPEQKRLFKGLLLLGVIVAIILLASLVASPLRVELVDHSVLYLVNVPYDYALIIAYTVAVVGSFLLSSVAFMRAFGIVLLALELLAAAFFTITFPSVWCFFAALLSVMLLIFVHTDAGK